MEQFVEKITEWTDLDMATHELAINIGLVKNSEISFATESKWIYWTDNIYYNALHSIIFHLVNIGLLLYDEDDMKVKSNTAFDLQAR